MACADPEPAGRSSGHSEDGGTGRRICSLCALLAQPILGILNINARGRRVDFFFLGELPPIVGPDKVLAKQAIAAHQIVAYVLLTLIALHAPAALFHHFVRRDDVLNAMLPVPAGEASAAGGRFRLHGRWNLSKGPALRRRSRLRSFRFPRVEGNAVSGVPFRVACFVGLRVDRLGTIGDPDPEQPDLGSRQRRSVITKSPNCDNRDAYISTQHS